MALPAVFVYLLCVLLLAGVHLDRLNPDGVVYLRLASYWASGQWSDAFSLYWSPLFPLSVAPLLWLGLDPLVAARLSLGLHGLLLLLATAGLLRAWTPVEPRLRALLLLAAAPALASLQLAVIAPDVLLSALLVAGFALLPRAARAEQPRAAFGVGLLAGLAVWAKSFALPFGLLHLPLSLWWLRRAEGRPAGRWIAAGLAGLLLPVLPLVTLLSWQNGGFTLGKSGPINHAVVGPDDIPRYHPVVWGVPTPPQLTIWEAPDRLPYRHWSPLASEKYFLHQLSLAAGNASAIARTLGRLDLAWLGAVVLLAVAIGGWLGRDWAGWNRPGAVWLGGTLLLYAGGYLPVAFETRYLQSFAVPLVLLAAALLAGALPRISWRWALTGLLAASLAMRWGTQIWADLGAVSPDYFRTLSGELQRAGLRGPFAATSWYHGIALAHHTGQAHAGFPPEADPAVVATRLREAGVNWIVFFDYPRLPPLPVQDLYPPTRPRALAVVEAEHWVRRADFRIRPGAGTSELRIMAFERPPGSTSQPKDGARREGNEVTGAVPQDKRDGVAGDLPAAGEQPEPVKPK